MNTPISLIVGLGNPGAEYHRTRHNTGADFVWELANRKEITLTPEHKFQGLCGRVSLGGRDVKLLIPTTFMNLSGRAVAAMANFYKIPVQQILVAHDELDLPSGSIRLKVGGGHGGHNGLRDIIKALGNNNFARLRIGINHPGNTKQVSTYVLNKAPALEQEQIDSSIDRALAILPQVVAGEWNRAMKALHTQ